MRRALQRCVFAFLRSEPVFTQVGQLPAKTPESGTASGVESQFAVLLEAFAALDASTLQPPCSEPGNPGQTLPATTPWTAIASQEAGTQHPDVSGETEANPEDQTEESVAGDSPAEWAEPEIPIIPAVSPVPVIITAVPVAVEASAPLAAPQNEPESGDPSAHPQDGALVTGKSLAPPARPLTASEPGLLRADAAGGRRDGAAPQVSHAQEDVSAAPPSIEAFKVELMDRTADNKTPTSESAPVRMAPLQRATPDTPESARIRVAASSEPAMAESTSPAEAPERHDENPGTGQRNPPPRRTGSFNDERELQVVPERRASSHPGERSTQTVSTDHRVKEHPAETAAPSRNGFEKPAAQSGAESVRQIEALRFGGVNLGRGGTVHDVEIRIPTAEAPIDVRLTSRGGTVDVSVRVADPQLAQDLRSHLPRLLDTLETRGYESNSPERRSETAEPQYSPPARFTYDADSEQQRRRDQQTFRHRPGSKRPSQEEASEEFRIEPDIRIIS